MFLYGCFFFFQAEDGIRDLVRSRGLGDVYKRQVPRRPGRCRTTQVYIDEHHCRTAVARGHFRRLDSCLLYTSDAADERSSVDLGGRRIINKKTN